MNIIPGQFDDLEEESEEDGAIFCAEEKALNYKPPISRQKSFQYDLQSDECLQFYTAKPISSEEIEAVGDGIYERMDNLLNRLTDNAEDDEEAIYAAYLKLLEEQKPSSIPDEEKICATDPAHICGPKLSIEEAEMALDAAAIDGSPRDYQQALYEIAKKRNTIVHLGTGKGKTLIALLLIKHFANGVFDVEGNTQQTLFVVPSVALALQQSTTLRVNLPYTVATACGVNQHQSLQVSKEADILVATHGAIHDLLMHYGDIFTMSDFNLVVFDECHYASGSHQYKLLMEKWYHTLPKGKRPHILGLTASPLMNIKHVHSDEHLATQLQALEETLDSRLATVRTISPCLFSSLDLMNNNAEELTIYYRAESSRESKNSSFPTHDHIQVHSSRKRELNQLRILYDDLGPLVVSIYCESVLNEVSCNVYEKESAGQFHILASHFQRVIAFCRSQISLCPRGGRSDKLLKLEILLEEQVQKTGSEGKGAVGLVFVQRRITAMALQSYFDSNQTLAKQNISSNDLPKLNEMPAHLKKNIVKIVTSKNSVLPHHSSSQFDDADGDHVHFRLRKRRQQTETNECNGTPDKSLEYSQFHDAEEGVQEQNYVDPPDQNVYLKKEVNGDQFEDADDDDDVIDRLSGVSIRDTAQRNGKKMDLIRCGVLVRYATHIFKYLNAANRNLAIYKAESNNGEKSNIEKEDSALPWLHQEVNISDTLDSLRKHKINVLLATSIVEEGVDVQACSFVICFDTVASTKTYIQMKGRARQKNAKFFLFHNDKDSSVLTDLQKAEQRVLMFIEQRQDVDISEVEIDKPFLKGSANDDDSENGLTNQSSSFELQALKDGHYHEALFGSVDLTSAKSLLNRYVLNIPVEANVRATKDAFLLHMPTFGDHELVLPAHLPADVRVVTLPEEYRTTNKNERQKMLALMACVRLHQCKLLNERLLPLSKKDLCHELVKIVRRQVSKVSPKAYNIKSLFEKNKKEVYLYPIIQRGEKLEEFLKILKSEDRSLALIMCNPVESAVDRLTLSHYELGELHVELGDMISLVITESEWDLIASFFSVLMSARWRRKSKKEWFRAREKEEKHLEVLPLYVVGLLNGLGKIDWTYMQEILTEFARSSEERTRVARSYSTTTEMKTPRLCQPIYNCNTKYIVLGPTKKDCRAKFPDHEDEIDTFHDYFKIKKDVELPGDDILFAAQRPFGMPARYVELDNKFECSQTISKPKPNETEFQEDCCELLSGLPAVYLPQHVCQESEMADPSLLLMSVALPQILYIIERKMVADAFISHCKANFPCLGSFLKKIPASELHVGMTAKATNITNNYDKYEWLGDGVLKLLQTDTLLNTPELRYWVQCLHEGDLTHLRSAMTNNEYLAAACRKVGFDCFVMDTPLARGNWIPQTLEIYSQQEEEEEVVVRGDRAPGMKSCADIMESILGLIYIHFGYKAATEVGVECGILLPQGSEVIELSYANKVPPAQAFEAVQVLTGRKHFNIPGLIEEAFTHPSAVHEAVPSYQRLEWVGDAVLCVKMREWIFTTFPHLSVGDMVTLDAAMVSNEVLGYQCFRSSLHTFINHRQQSLPARIERYKWSVGKDVGRGIWGSDPPKILSDVVEAVLGAVHTDGGFQAGQVAVETMMRPLMDAVKTLKGDATVFRHPITILNEIGGRLFDIEIAREDTFLRDRGRGVQAWHGIGWREACVDGRETIGSVLSVGKDIISVLEPSMKSARNRACALVVAAFEDNDELQQRWKEISTIIERQSTHNITSHDIASDDEDEYDNAIKKDKDNS